MKTEQVFQTLYILVQYPTGPKYVQIPGRPLLNQKLSCPLILTTNKNAIIGSLEATSPKVVSARIQLRTAGLKSKTNSRMRRAQESYKHDCDRRAKKPH